MSEIFFLLLGMFITASSSHMTAGLLPQISATLGRPVGVTSQGITIFSVTYVLTALFFSFLVSNKSAKRPLQIALTLFLLGNIVTIVSDSVSIFFLGRFVTAIGAGVFNPLCVSVALRLGTLNLRKGRVLSLIWGATSASLVFGVPAGIYISSKLGWQYSLGFISLLALSALVGITVCKLDVSTPEPSSLKERFILLKDKKTLAILSTSSIAAMASLGLYSYISIIHDKDATPLALALFSWGLGAVAGSSSTGFFIDRYKHSRSLPVFVLTGLMLAILSLTVTRFSTGFTVTSFFFWGAFGWALPILQQHQLISLNEKHSTLLTALNSSAFGLGNSLGTAGGGVLLLVGIQGRYFPIISGCILACLVIYKLILSGPARNAA